MTQIPFFSNCKDDMSRERNWLERFEGEFARDTAVFLLPVFIVTRGY